MRMRVKVKISTPPRASKGNTYNPITQLQIENLLTQTPVNVLISDETVLNPNPDP